MSSPVKPSSYSELVSTPNMSHAMLYYRLVTDLKIVDCYRNKTCTAIEGVTQDVKTMVPHYETRVGKRRWSERMRRGEKRDDES